MSECRAPSLKRAGLPSNLDEKRWSSAVPPTLMPRLPITGPIDPRTARINGTRTDEHHPYDCLYCMNRGLRDEQ